MKIGIIGLPQVGKKTIFKLLTGIDLSQAEQEKLRSPFKGIITVKDPRLDKIRAVYSPKKTTPAQIEAVLMPKIEGEYIKSGILFEHLNDADAICHIVRAFKDEMVYHVEGSVNPARDIDTINVELILSDLEFVEKRLERINKDSKRKNEAEQEKEKILLAMFKEHLEKGLPLCSLDIGAEHKKFLTNYPFITLKPTLAVLNTGEDDLKKEILPKDLAEKYKKTAMYIMQVSAKIENELAGLDSPEERESFLKELGIDEPAINKLTRLLYKALGLVSFFTGGPSEARAWTIRRNSTAPQAAGAIHSDMERGFIRAEVIKYKDLIELGSEAKVKEAGRLMVKGKDYIVEDGDLLNIRFSV
ncbi:MAG: redox-regulated ATPase YchF [Candidatus Omnitrophota bacterium]